MREGQSDVKSVIRNGKTLLSGVDPVRLCERTADAVSVKDKTLYLCPSPLYGYGLARLLSRLETEAPNSAILCAEADSELYELTEKNIDPNLLKNKMLRITNISEAPALCALVRETWGSPRFRRVEMLKFSGGWQLFPELYDSLCEALRREIAVDWSNALTLAKLGRLYIRNALRNLSLVTRLPSISNLSFGDAPVLVLGAGPSLDETLDSLRICGDSNRPFKIICVDTSLSALKDRNIVPDLVVILESQLWNLGDFIGCRGWNVRFAVDLSALPESARILGGDGFLFVTPWTKLRLFERLNATGLLPSVLPPLGSVSLSAVELARRLTRGKIIISGLDFSFTADKYHARSTPGHRGRLAAQSRFRGTGNAALHTASFAAVSKSGLPVYSNPALNNYRSLFEQEFAADSRLFDIEGSGLNLGVKTLSMDEALGVLSEKSSLRGAEAQREEGRGRKSAAGLTEKVLTFLLGEKDRLINLRSILTGEEAAEEERLNVLVDECDYLWGHFPDYSLGRRADLGDVSFLKRLRAEIDPMLALIERVIS